MKKYIEIQREVMKDYDINPYDLSVPFKNSIKSTLDVFYNVGILVTKDADTAEEFKEELRKKYNLAIFIK